MKNRVKFYIIRVDNKSYGERATERGASSFAQRMAKQFPDADVSVWLVQKVYW